jgi:hypothetical protein
MTGPASLPFSAAAFVSEAQSSEGHLCTDRVAAEAMLGEERPDLLLEELQGLR